MIEHIKKDHKFSDKQIERSLETNPDSFKNFFEEIKLNRSENTSHNYLEYSTSF